MEHMRAAQTPTGRRVYTMGVLFPLLRVLKAGCEVRRWEHGSAIKAIAFCPWFEGLLATGGGSNDRMIHFYHTTSGGAINTIHVSAQVTSLVWAPTRREIAATYGYAQPDHAIRIAVFAWPSCHMVTSIPWEGEHRALYSLYYPFGPGEWQPPVPAPPRADSETSSAASADDDTEEPPFVEEGLPWGGNAWMAEFGAIGGPNSFHNGYHFHYSNPWAGNRGRGEYERLQRNPPVGCLVVACSDESVKFHEVWGRGSGNGDGDGPRHPPAGNVPGMLGGSAILESLAGIDRDGDFVIR